MKINFSTLLVKLYQHLKQKYSNSLYFMISDKRHRVVQYYNPTVYNLRKKKPDVITC